MMSGGFLWLAASTGLLSLLTPCVFPMVPVTVAYFSAPEKHDAGIRRALLFGAGIVATFTVLGLALAAVFGAAGLNRFAANPYVNLLLAALFLIFAATLFGWLNFQLPWRWLTAANRAAEQQQRGSLGALFMGAAFTMTSLTCTAPFVGTLLVLAAQGTWTTPVIGMLVYSTAFAVPFVLLAIAPRFVARLPRAGQWMQTVRILIGILEIGAAMKFVSNADLVWGWAVFTRAAVLTLWAMLALFGAAYLARRALSEDRGVGALRLGGLAAAGGALLVSLWLASGITGTPLRQVEAFLPPPATTVLASTAGTTPSWILNDYSGALDEARRSGKLVFIDFTGYTCTNCRWMEANIFSRPDVGAELGQFVLARLYTDGDGELYQRQQSFQERTFGTVALPLYAVVDGQGAVRATFSGLTREPAEFISFLRNARAPKVATAQ